MTKFKRKKQLPSNPAEQYAWDILTGKILSNRWVKLACKRHMVDRYGENWQGLDESQGTGQERGLKFDENEAWAVISFFDLLRHSKGEWAGQKFILEPWQHFIIWNLFGWVINSPDEDGNCFRRFKTGYLEIARKNGKTTLIAGIGLYLFCADGEPGAEVYSAAVKRDQAIISHAEATRMVKKSPDLRSLINIFKNNLSIESDACKFEPLGRDSDSCDGLNVSGALVDELHAHKTRDMWDVLETATGSRRQPLQIAITTSGFDRQSICWEQHEYVQKILNGIINDDTYFGIIYSIDTKIKDEDKEDDWKDESNWIKANPNLGVSVKLEDLQRKAMKAKEMPSALNNFLRKHLDVWVAQSTRWINIDLWDKNYAYDIRESDLLGKLCFGGLDLSTVSDLTAWVMIFPDEGNPEQVDVLARFWCPESKLYDRSNRYRHHYESWHRDGWLNIVPGDAIDYDEVREQVLLDARHFNLDSMNVDRLFQGFQLSMELARELAMGKKERVATMGMGFYSMAGPMLELEKRLLNRNINHGNNPIMRFMADNLAVATDAAGNYKPDKANSQGKIDGIVALVMALDRCMRKELKGKSKYESEDLLVI